MNEDEPEQIEEQRLLNNDKRFLVEYREDLDQFTKAAIALKMTEVLGQLARSFASALKGNIKINIVSETINLGLRFLSAMYEIETEDLQELRRILAQLIKNKNLDLSEDELLGRADRILHFSFFGLTVGVVRKISGSIGHEDLKGSFDRIFTQNNSSLGYRLVESAVRLDHYSDPLVERIIKFGEELEKDNRFIWDVLQTLVANHLNLNTASETPQRQKLMHYFELGDSNQFLLNGEVAERKYLPKPRPRFSPPSTDNPKKTKPKHR